MIHELPDVVYNLLDRRYQIIEHMSFLEFDHDFEILRSRLTACKKKKFNVNDRIIIEHFDTDYYFDQCTTGVNLRNFFVLLEELDIPRYIFIFYTNHFGLQKETDSLCQYCEKQDRPTIIESFLSKLSHDPSKLQDIDCDFHLINHHALCMMHLTRSHRNAMYHALKHIPPDTLVLNTTKNLNANQ